MLSECTIIRDLATGGQKRVRLATHPRLGDVVLKTGDIKSFTSLERIKREIELLSELKSPFYPEQFHFNVDVKSKKFEIIEAYVHGQPLRDAMSAHSDPAVIFPLLLQLIEGLTIIWNRSIVHRDLKPENIIIRDDNSPCIIDLGIARFLDLETLTQTLAPMGPCTPIYASPEQLANQRHFIDHRSDFFSLGIICLELYLGFHPFDPTHVGNHYSIVENIMQMKYVVKMPGKPAHLGMSQLAAKLLKSQPYMRLRNPEQLKSFVTQLI